MSETFVDRQAQVEREIAITSAGGGGRVAADLSEMRGWLIVLATLAASVTYQAGLNPPGGFWQDDNNGHQAGNPVLFDRVPKRYLTFYYFNATALVTSLVIIILLLNKRFYESEAKVAALVLTTMVDLMSLLGAYVAGSTRDVHSSIYVIVITCILFVCIVYMARALPNLCYIVLLSVPPLFKLVKQGWLPIPDSLKKMVEQANNKNRGQDEEKGKSDVHSKTWRNRPCFCPCGRAIKHDVDETGQAPAAQ